MVLFWTHILINPNRGGKDNYYMGYKLKRRAKTAPQLATAPVGTQEATHRAYLPEPAETHEIAAVERVAQASSRQPRNTGDLSGFWHSTVQWVREMGDMPDMGRCGELDRWCRDRLFAEPYLAGFFSKVVTAQANRGWSINGGKRTVNATAALLHRFDPVSVRLPSGYVYTDAYKAAGWRKAQKRKIFSYLTRNAGAFTEIQYRLEPRFTRNGWSLSQVSNLYNMDSGKTQWTGDPLFPIEYAGSKPWPAPSFYHLVAMPLDQEEHYNIGLSPLYRCINLAKLMVSISEWETGSLAPDLLDSLLILNGTTPEQFNEAMKARLTVGNQGNRAKRAGVLGSDDPDNKIDADVLSLRAMPPSLESFETRIHLLLQGYAVNLGYALDFFMDSAHGSLLGRSGTEVVAASRSTADSGGNDYHLEDQAQLNQLVMPAGVEFLYDDLAIDERELAEINEIRARTITELFTAQRLADDYKGGELLAFARGRGNNLGTALQFQQLMVQWGIVPPDWTADEEDVSVEDIEQHRLKERVLSTEAAHHLITEVEAGRMRDDSLVRYHYSPEKDRHGITTVVPSIKRHLDEQARTFLIGNVRRQERATKKEVKDARKLLLDRLVDARSIKEGLADG